MKKAYFLVVLFLCGLSVGNLFAAAADDLGEQLIKAAWKGDEAEVDRLIAAGADVNAHDQAGWTALMVAAQEGHADIVNLLLQEAANVNAANMNGSTALMKAAEQGHENIMKLLLQAGAEIEGAVDLARNSEDYTPSVRHIKAARFNR